MVKIKLMVSYRYRIGSVFWYRYRYRYRDRYRDLVSYRYRWKKYRIVSYRIGIVSETLRVCSGTLYLTSQPGEFTLLSLAHIC